MTTPLFFLSFLFLLSAFYFFKKIKYTVTSGIIFSISCFFVVFQNLLYIASDYITGNGITDATIYYIKYGLVAGINTMGSFEQRSFLFFVVIFIITIVIFLQSPRVLKARSFSNKKIKYKIYTLSLIIMAGISSPTFFWFMSINDPFDSHDVSKKVESFYKFYKVPRIKQVKEKKNLVYIYMEGVEREYSNEEIFPGLTPGLNELRKKSISFSDIQQVPGSGFTIGGMVASQCGISLYGIMYANSMSGMDKYLPLAVCLGDLLHNEGYFLSYIGGADSNFSGKKLFYLTHGFDEVIGKEELSGKIQNPEYKSKWGIYDDTLLDITFEKFINLSENKTNFGLFLLTLDTHQPSEAPSKICKNILYDTGNDKTLNAVKCSDYLVSRFVDRIMNSKYADETVIVISSDHLAPHSPTTGSKEYIKRSNRFDVITPNSESFIEVSRTGSTLDIGATILSFIGFEGELGLGRNLLDKSLPESDAVVIRQLIKSWGEELGMFWGYPKIEKGFTIDTEKMQLILNDRFFKLPLLIEVDENLQTKLKFEFYIEFAIKQKKEDLDLIAQAKSISKNKGYILIDSCEKIQRIKEIIKMDGVCMLSSYGNKYKVTFLTGVREFSKKEIKTLIGL